MKNQNKSLRINKVTTHVTPTKVGVQSIELLDFGFRRNDEPEQLRNHWGRMWMAIVSLLIPCLAQGANISAGQVFRKTLENGLQVIIVYNPLSPVVTSVVNYKVGSDEVPADFPGTAHAMEHMMFRGSPGISADQLAEIGADVGGRLNADTQQNLTQYFYTVPSQYLDTVLHIESLRMRAISAKKSSWDKERGAIEQEVSRDLSSPEYVFYVKLLKFLFKGTPYEHDALGTRPSFDKTTAQALGRFHKDWYGPNNAILVIAGDLNPNETFKTVSRLFGKIPRIEMPKRPDFNFNPVKASFEAINTDSPYGMAAFAFRFPGSDSPDYAAVQILSDALSNPRGPLYELQVKGDALFAGFSYEGLPKAGIGFAIAGFPKGANSKNLLKKVKAVLKEQLSKGINPDFVAAAKRREEAAAEFQKNSIEGLAMEWSEAVAGEGRRSPDEDIEAIKKVTAEDVARVAKKYIDFDHAVSAILTPQPSGKPVSGKGFGGQESFASSSVKAVPLPPWAKKEVESLAIPPLTLHPIVSRLSNGIELIVQPETISPTVSIMGHIMSNPDTETALGKEGVDRVLGELFPYGSRSLDRIAFQKALDDIAADESAGTDFSLNVLSKHFEDGVKLLAQNELSPALPKGDFKIIRHEVSAELVGELQSPDYLTGRAIDKALYPKTDPILREATPKTAADLSLNDVKQYYHKVFRPDMTTIVVIGQVDPQKAKTVIERYFGSWKAAGAKPNIEYPRVPDNRFSKINIPDSSRLQDKVVLIQTVGMNRLSPNYYALNLGNEILGGAFYASRLSLDLRKKTGLAYAANSYWDAGRVRSTYRIVYGSDPDKALKAKTLALNDIAAMQKKYVSPEELRQGKILLLRGIPLGEASFDGVASKWLYLSRFGLALDEPERAAKIYVDLKAEDVRRAFSEWLHPSDMAEIVEGPAPKN